MARIFLNRDQKFVVANDGSELIGTAGNEQVVILADITSVNVSSSIERIDLPDVIAGFMFSNFGATLTIRDTDGNIIATVSDAGGKKLAFGEGSVDVAFDVGTGELTVGGVVVDGTPTAITPEASQIDETEKSESAPNTGDNDNAGAPGNDTGEPSNKIVNVNGVDNAPTADDTVDELFVFAEASYTATIAGFDPVNDSLDFPDTGANNISLVNTADDGEAQLVWSDGGSTIAVNLVGLNSTQDQALTSLSDFNIA